MDTHSVPLVLTVEEVETSLVERVCQLLVGLGLSVLLAPSLRNRYEKSAQWR